MIRNIRFENKQGKAVVFRVFQCLIEESELIISVVSEASTLVVQYPTTTDVEDPKYFSPEYLRLLSHIRNLSIVFLARISPP